MVDLAITATAVVAGASSNRTQGSAGAAITAGQLVVQNPADNKYVLADTNHADVNLRKATGIALNGAALDQPIAILTGGDITIGATLVAGTDYWASDTPGGICPRADVGPTEQVVQVGIARSTTVLGVDFQYPGVTLP